MGPDEEKKDPFQKSAEVLHSTKAKGFTDRNLRALRAQADKIQSKNKKLQSNDRKLAKSIEESERDRLAQANKLRPWFMGISLALAAAVVLSSAFTMVWLTLKGELTDPIGVGFIVSLAIEVVGIIAIIAHYLFSTPDSKLLNQKKKID